VQRKDLLTFKQGSALKGGSLTGNGSGLNAEWF